MFASALIDLTTPQKAPVQGRREPHALKLQFLHVYWVQSHFQAIVNAAYELSDSMLTGLNISTLKSRIV
ncbi:MAG: hypothetical protein P4L46_02170 [Fimbriimonas sp.]|nr:hypothetical protein [Fimbriimonas sp.]